MEVNIVNSKQNNPSREPNMCPDQFFQTFNPLYLSADQGIWERKISAWVIDLWSSFLGLYLKITNSHIYKHGSTNLGYSQRTTFFFFLLWT